MDKLKDIVEEASDESFPASDPPAWAGKQDSKPELNQSQNKQSIIYSIIFYVPESHLEQLKEALFLAGAGRVNERYDQCSWQTLGTSQYRPLPGSQPSRGKINKITYLEEYKVEVLCKADHIIAALKALVKAHPYETPTYTIQEIAIPILPD